MTCRQALHLTLALAGSMACFLHMSLWLAENDAVLDSLLYCGSLGHWTNRADSAADYDMTTAADY